MEPSDLEYLQENKKRIRVLKDDPDWLKIEVQEGADGSELYDVLDGTLTEGISDDDMDSITYQFPPGKHIIMLETSNKKLCATALKILKEIGVE